MTEKQHAYLFDVLKYIFASLDTDRGNMILKDNDSSVSFLKIVLMLCALKL